MSYLDHDGLAYFKSKLDRTFIADIVFDDGDILLYGGDGTLLKTVVQEGTVTQKKSTANKEYPVLLCWDADAEEDQTMKTVWYGLDARINPKFGYLYARRYYTEHPSYERTNAPTARTEWHHIFTDAVSAPMGEVYEYLDRVADGGEHRMELRLYGNPLSQYVDTPNHNEATDVVSIGVGATKGDKLTFFGYCPSTPIYLENGSTMRKSTVRGDQYGKDIITRDWLNLNGSITGLVHTYMDETVDGYKTFLKTVTIDSGDDNNKAGLNVQGDVNIDSGDNTKPSNLYVQGNSHIHGNEDIDGNLNVDGTSTLDGNVHMKHNLDVDGNLNVDGTSDQHGNVHMYSNLDVDGNANTDGNQTIGGTLTVTGKITGNGGAEISGGNGLKVNGNETVTGDLGVGGTINKISGNTTQEYVTYVTNQADTRKNIAQNLVDTSRGVGYDPSTGKIYAKIDTTQGLKFSSSGAMQVDFSDMPTDKFEALLKALKMLIPLSANLDLYVDTNGSNTIENGRGTQAKPFATINGALTYVTQTYNLNSCNVTIYVMNGDYGDATTVLPAYSTGSGVIQIRSLSGNKSDVKVGGFRLETAATYEIFYLTCTRSNIERGQTGAIQASNSGVIKLRDVLVDMSDVQQGNGTLHALYATSSGVISWWAYDDNTHATGITLKANASSDISSMIHASGGTISFAADLNVTGTFSVPWGFINVSSFGWIDCNYSSNSNPGRTPHVNSTATVTGKRFNASMLSIVSGRGADLTEAKAMYPGSEDGTLDSSSVFRRGDIIN